jgi:hypothetical protein
LSLLLATNIISEWVKPQPNPHIVQWLATIDEDRLSISVVTFAEIRFGVERLPTGQRRARLAVWLTDELPRRFENRVHTIDGRVAEAWGVVVARAGRTGVAVSAMDGFIAATAEVHGLTVVTRNVRHFAPLGVPAFDPATPPL